MPTEVSLRYLPLQSSQIMGLAYDLSERRLYVQFNNQTWYEYDDVEPEVVLQVIIASSQGKAFDEKVKKGGYVSTASWMKTPTSMSKFFDTLGAPPAACSPAPHSLSLNPSPWQPLDALGTKGQKVGLKQDERTSLAHMIEMMKTGVISKETIMEAMGFDMSPPPPAPRTYKHLEVADDGHFILVGAQVTVKDDLPSIRDLPPDTSGPKTFVPMAERTIGIDPAMTNPADRLHGLSELLKEEAPPNRVARRKKKA